ncbi:MAG: DUF669 domain-containing protein [Bradymonadaceae bacterium]
MLRSKLEDKYGDDPTEVDTSGAFDGPNLDLPLKPGEYLVEILPDHTEETGTQSGGEMLKLDMKVLGPESENRRLFPQYITDCPSNRDFEDEELERVLALYHAAGGEGYPAGVEDFVGKRLIVETGLEENSYQGETEYRSTIWDVKPESEGPARGAWADKDQPDIWQTAKDHAKSSDSGEDDGANGGKTKSFDDDDLDF